MRKSVVVTVVACALIGCLNSAAAFAAEGGTTWSMDSSCGACHTKEAATQEAAIEEKAGPAEAKDGAIATDETVDDTTPLAAAHAALSCTSCHSDAKALEKVHDGATADDRMPKRLRKAKISTELCISCHGSYEELAAATQEEQALTDGVGRTVNPHDLPAVEEHEKIDCLDCHSMHKEQSSTTAAMNTCTGCHHTGTFECGTCH